MRIIKNINNNFAIAIDGAGNQLIVSGKGIGFGEVPRELEDITIINRSYYDVDESYVSMINEIPEEIINISSKIVDKAREEINNPLSSNIVFTLADHLNFAIERMKKRMSVKLPIIQDIKYLFEREVKIGEYGVNLIWDTLKIYLPKEEAVYIALHIINAEEKNKSESENEDDDIIQMITKIIEEEFNVGINRENINYSRFVSHMHYLLRRGRSKQLFKTINEEIYDNLKKEFPKTHECADKVSAYLSSFYGINLNKEENLYLMLHINRLSSRDESAL